MLHLLHKKLRDNTVTVKIIIGVICLHAITFAFIFLGNAAPVERISIARSDTQHNRPVIIMPFSSVTGLIVPSNKNSVTAQVSAPTVIDSKKTSHTTTVTSARTQSHATQSKQPTHPPAKSVVKPKTTVNTQKLPVKKPATPVKKMVTPVKLIPPKKNVPIKKPAPTAPTKVIKKVETCPKKTVASKPVATQKSPAQKPIAAPVIKPTPESKPMCAPAQSSLPQIEVSTITAPVHLAAVTNTTGMVITGTSDTISAPIIIARSSTEKHALETRHEVQQELLRVWHPPLGTAAGTSCCVRVELDAAGVVTDIATVYGSGILLFDLSARAAVQTAQWPASLWGTQIELVLE